MGKKIGTQGAARVTVTLERDDLELLDRLANLEGSNRSAELRQMLKAVRPMLKATVDALEAAERTKDTFYEQAAAAALGDLASVVPEIEKINYAYLGALSRLEGAAAARPPASNTGVTFMHPPLLDPSENDSKESE